MTAVATKLKELETRVTWLEHAVQDLRDAEQPEALNQEEMERLSERERVLAELKAEGLIRDPTPEERAHAEQWRALPEDEKQAVIQAMQNLGPGPMLSDIIIQNRR